SVYREPLAEQDNPNSISFKPEEPRGVSLKASQLAILTGLIPEEENMSFFEAIDYYASFLNEKSLFTLAKNLDIRRRATFLLHILPTLSAARQQEIFTYNPKLAKNLVIFALHDYPAEVPALLSIINQCSYDTKIDIKQKIANVDKKAESALLGKLGLYLLDCQLSLNRVNSLSLENINAYNSAETIQDSPHLVRLLALTPESNRILFISALGSKINDFFTNSADFFTILTMLSLKNRYKFIEALGNTLHNFLTEDKDFEKTRKLLPVENRGQFKDAFIMHFIKSIKNYDQLLATVSTYPDQSRRITILQAISEWNRQNFVNTNEKLMSILTHMPKEHWITVLMLFKSTITNLIYSPVKLDIILQTLPQQDQPHLLCMLNRKKTLNPWSWPYNFNLAPYFDQLFDAFSPDDWFAQIESFEPSDVPYLFSCEAHVQKVLDSANEEQLPILIKKMGSSIEHLSINQRKMYLEKIIPIDKKIELLVSLGYNIRYFISDFDELCTLIAKLTSAQCISLISALGRKINDYISNNEAFISLLSFLPEGNARSSILTSIDAHKLIKSSDDLDKVLPYFSLQGQAILLCNLNKQKKAYSWEESVVNFDLTPYIDNLFYDFPQQDWFALIEALDTSVEHLFLRADHVKKVLSSVTVQQQPIVIKMIKEKIKYLTEEERTALLKSWPAEHKADMVMSVGSNIAYLITNHTDLLEALNLLTTEQRIEPIRILISSNKIPQYAKNHEELIALLNLLPEGAIRSEVVSHITITQEFMQDQDEFNTLINCLPENYWPKFLFIQKHRLATFFTSPVDVIMMLEKLPNVSAYLGNQLTKMEFIRWLHIATIFSNTNERITLINAWDKSNWKNLISSFYLITAFFTNIASLGDVLNTFPDEADRVALMTAIGDKLHEIFEKSGNELQSINALKTLKPLLPQAHYITAIFNAIYVKNSEDTKLLLLALEYLLPDAADKLALINKFSGDKLRNLVGASNYDFPINKLIEILKLLPKEIRFNVIAQLNGSHNNIGLSSLKLCANELGELLCLFPQSAWPQLLDACGTRKIIAILNCIKYKKAAKPYSNDSISTKPEDNLTDILQCLPEESHIDFIELLCKKMGTDFSCTIYRNRPAAFVTTVNFFKKAEDRVRVIDLIVKNFLYSDDIDKFRRNPEAVRLLANYKKGCAIQKRANTLVKSAIETKRQQHKPALTPEREVVLKIAALFDNYANPPLFSMHWRWNRDTARKLFNWPLEHKNASLSDYVAQIKTTLDRVKNSNNYNENGTFVALVGLALNEAETFLQARQGNQAQFAPELF
ncbi:MAG: hypothetical protein K2Q14_01235, partial [Gammaproteobacteria bacterium]|nr:hypothetical protein [Gammaproteobacteria bacterium]